MTAGGRVCACVALWNSGDNSFLEVFLVNKNVAARCSENIGVEKRRLLLALQVRMGLNTFQASEQAALWSCFAILENGGFNNQSSM